MVFRNLAIMCSLVLAPLAAAAQTEDHGPDWFKVVSPESPLNLRPDPSARNTPITAMPDGTIVRNLGCEARWCRVETLSGQTGWAAARYLAEGAGPGSAPAPAEQFDATGLLPCSLRYGQPTFNCKFGVNRRAEGDADITVFWPEGSGRQMAFRGGVPATAGVNTERRGDLTVIELDEERYEIPDAVVFGG